MVFADWTHTGVGSAALDTATKYAGSASCRIRLNGINGTATFTHNTFLEPQAQIVAWIRKYQYGGSWDSHPKVQLSTYGNIDVAGYLNNETWEKFRVTFWYDATANVKFGRLEKWIDSAWVQQGDDTNFGAGSPLAGTLSLIAYATSIAYSKDAWFDEVEVSA